MKRHHLLMIERDDRGDIVAGHEVPNNEWARCRRKGWDFATAEETVAYQQMQADALADKNRRKEEGPPPAVDEGSITAGAGGWYEVKLGDRTEKAQGEDAANAMLNQMKADAAAE